MYLFSATSLLLFLLFQHSRLLNGPVGIAFAVSMGTLGAVGILYWVYESTASKPTGLSSLPIIRDQLLEFIGFPLLAKIGVLLGSLSLPMIVDAIMRT